MKAFVAIVMGSKSDLPVMKDAAAILDGLAIPYALDIVSAHRTPELLQMSCAQWEKAGLKCIIAGAGGAAHLPGMLASFCNLPVIGVPIKSRALKGLDSLLSISQMPKGIPVATVAIDNAFNAGLLAARILAQGDSAQARRIKKDLEAYAKGLNRSVQKDRKKLKTKGWNQFLKQL